MANSWMQTPQGFEVVTDPAPVRAVMTDFGQVVFTPSFLPRLLHVFVASWTAGSALMLSVSAWYVLRGRHLDLAKSNFSLALPFFIVLTISNVVLFGAEPGDRGDPSAAAQAGLDGGAVAGHHVRAAVPVRVGRHRHPDDAWPVDPVPAQRPGLLQPAGVRAGPERLPGRAGPADRPAVSGLSPDVHAGLAVRARRPAGRAVLVPQEGRQGRRRSAARIWTRVRSCGCS